MSLLPPLARIAGSRPAGQHLRRHRAWAQRSLPDYLLTHSVGPTAGRDDRGGEGWSFDRRVLWTAALMHDVG
jgi:hypothetical protein